MGGNWEKRFFTFFDRESPHGRRLICLQSMPGFNRKSLKLHLKMCKSLSVYFGSFSHLSSFRSGVFSLRFSYIGSRFKELFAH